MLTIQPNLSQKRMHSLPGFGNNYQRPDFSTVDDTDLFDETIEDDSFGYRDQDSRIAEKNADLEEIKDGVNKTIANIKGLEEEIPLPNWAKQSMGVLYTLGAALVAGIGTKFGFSKTSEYLGELANKQSIKKASGNIKGSLKNLGKAFGRCIDSIKNTPLFKAADKKFTNLSNKFNATSLGKGIKSLSDKFSKNSFVVKTKEFFSRITHMSGKKVVDRTGDVIGTATGVSTAAVGVIDPEKKERLEG